jgi:gas vesicle protein
MGSRISQFRRQDKQAILQAFEMTKHITITLTTDQANRIKNVLRTNQEEVARMAQSVEMSPDPKSVAFDNRIIAKIADQLNS